MKPAFVIDTAQQITKQIKPKAEIRLVTFSLKNVGTNVADKQRSLGRCSSLADSGHGIS
jgi:hypothetical protein